MNEVFFVPFQIYLVFGERMRQADQDLFGTVALIFGPISLFIFLLNPWLGMHYMFSGGALRCVVTIGFVEAFS